MNIQMILRGALALIVAALATTAAFAGPAEAGAAAPSAREIAGTVDTRVVLNRFTASGRTVIGHGTATSTVRYADGTMRVQRKAFRVKVRQQQGRLQQEELCHILFLELDELDLTLLGLRVHLRSADPNTPIQLRLQARRSGGILGRLFCDLAQGTATPARARSAATQLNRQVKAGTTILRARATLFGPQQRVTNGSAGTAQETEECAVLHLILGPLHLDLLGLIVDLSKIELDITAIPGTLIGDIFCALGGNPTDEPPREDPSP